MKKSFLIAMLLLCAVFCLLLGGCGAADAVDAGSKAESDNTEVGQENDETAAQSEGETAMHKYSTQEIWVQNGDLRIYGIAYVPDTDGKMPLVIFSHELGNDHRLGHITDKSAQEMAQLLGGGDVTITIGSSS